MSGLTRTKPNLLLLLLGFLLTAALFLSGCQGDKGKEVISAEAPEEEETFSAFCPLDGEGLEEPPSGRPLAVIIDNSPRARPQAGLPQADLVYEFPAEGGITRFMAIYYHGQAERVGPVRSARPYFMDQALGWDAVFVHVGQSPQSLAYYKTHQVDHIDEFSRSKAFWRDKTRKAPHNLYTSTSLLKEMAAQLNFERDVKLTGFHFAQGVQTLNGKPANFLEILYPEKLNRVQYQYEASTGLYKRFTAGEKHLDEVTGEQLAAKNIVVQYVQARVFDDEGRLDVSMLGEGPILFFSQGQVVEGKWVKDDRRQPTKFLDLNGQPLSFSSGQTWIQIVSDKTKVNYRE